MQKEYMTILHDGVRYRDTNYTTDASAIDSLYWIGEDGTLRAQGQIRTAYPRYRHAKDTGEVIGNPRYYFNCIREDDTWHDFSRSKMVAEAFCPNAKHKPIVHHIDGDCSNDHYCNLIWVTEEEHIECHRLMRTGDKAAYDAYIAMIRADNYESVSEHVYNF